MEGHRYRCGQAADELGVSRHIMRRLATCGLVEHVEINGRLYFPTEEVERLKRTGIPPLPAPTREDDPIKPAAGAGHHETNGPEERRGQVVIQRDDLYAPPSERLAQSKEEVLRLQHTLEKRRLQRDLQEENEGARKRQQKAREEQALQQRKSRWLAWAANAIPDDCGLPVHTPIQRAVTDLLSMLPGDYPEITVQKQVEAIVRHALEPYRRQRFREDATKQAVASRLPTKAKQTAEWQERAALEANNRLAALPMSANDDEVRRCATEAVDCVAREFTHRQKLEEAASFISLTTGASLDEYEQAKAVVCKALRGLEHGASDQDIRRTKERVLADVNRPIEERNAKTRHRNRIESALLFVSTPYGTTQQETKEIESRLRIALEALPPTASPLEFSEAQERTKAPLVAAIKARIEAESKAAERGRNDEAALDRSLAELWRYLWEAYEFASEWDARREADRIKIRLKPALLLQMSKRSFLNEASVSRWLHAQVDELLEDDDEN